MNKYENLPDCIPTDVDISIDKKTFIMLDSLLKKISSQNNIEITQKIWHGYYKCAYILSPLHIDSPFRLQLDFFVDFSTKGYPNLIPNEIILNNRIKYKNFYVPAPEIEVPFLLMRRIIKNDLTESHIEKLRELLKKKPEEVKAKLVEFFGEEITSSLLNLIETGDKSIFHSNLDYYRRILKKIFAKNTNLIYKIKCNLSQLKRILKRLLHPVGFSVVFLSPDGGGKTTIANLVLERVSGSFHGGKVQYWRPYLLPAMGRLKFWNPSEEPSTNPDPHGHPKQNPIKSLIRFFYYLTDYLVGYTFKVYLAKVRKKIIIFDRYYYDYLVDLHRYRFNLPKWLPKIFLPLIPSTDLTIYLDAEPEDLLKRKQELSLKELKRQVKEFRKIVPKLPNSFLIRTDRPIEDIVREVSYLILHKKAEQTKKILKSEY
jgi:thymidylate kinase